jgi:hypothetical protein
LKSVDEGLRAVRDRAGGKRNLGLQTWHKQDRTSDDQ